MNDMNPAFAMPDVQSSHDNRQIPIQRVGVRGVRYPMSLQTPSGVLNTVGTYNLDVHLPADQKVRERFSLLDLLFNIIIWTKTVECVDYRSLFGQPSVVVHRMQCNV